MLLAVELAPLSLTPRKDDDERIMAPAAYAARERARESAIDAAEDEVTPTAADEPEPRRAIVAAAVADRPVEAAAEDADADGDSSNCGSVARNEDLSESAATERRKANAVPECQHDCGANQGGESKRKKNRVVVMAETMCSCGLLHKWSTCRVMLESQNFVL